MPEDIFLQLPNSRQKQDRRRSEVWMCSTPEKLNTEELGSSLVLHQLPCFLFLLCSSLWTGIFAFDFLPVLLLPILWFVAPIDAWTRPRKGLLKEKCIISNVCLLGPANDPPRKETVPHLCRPPDKVSKEVVLPVHYLAVTVHEHLSLKHWKILNNLSPHPYVEWTACVTCCEQGEKGYFKTHANLLLSLLWLEEIGDILLKWKAYVICGIHHHSYLSSSKHQLTVN